MPIELRKFRYNGVKNYFAGGGNRPSFVDKIIMNGIHMDDPPRFKEEFENQFDNFNFVFSDFSLKYWLMQPELSQLGYSIGGFFENDMDNHCIVCEAVLENETKRFAGFMDLTTIWWNETITQKRYDVSFTCYSAGKELKDLGNTAPQVPAHWFRNFNDYIKQCHFWTQAPIQLNIKTDYLTWNNHIGWEPRLIPCPASDTLDNIWDWMLQQNQLKFPSQTNATTKWQLFEDLCKFWGIVYRFECTGSFTENLFGFTMYLGFRNTLFGSNQVTTQMESIEHGYSKSNQLNEYVYFKYMQETRIEGSIENRDFSWNKNDYGYGVIYKFANVWYARGRVLGNINEYMYRWDSENKYQLGQSGSTFIDFPMQNVTEVQASVYFNPSTEELPDRNSHWSYGTEDEVPAFNEPHWNFSPKNFSFPAMFSHPTAVTTIVEAPGLIQGKFQSFRVVNIPGSVNIYTPMQLMYLHTVQQYLFLAISKMAKVFKCILNLTGGLTYKIFDKTTIRGVVYALYSFEDTPDSTKKLDSLWKEFF